MFKSKMLFFVGQAFPMEKSGSAASPQAVRGWPGAEAASAPIARDRCYGAQSRRSVPAALRDLVREATASTTAARRTRPAERSCALMTPEEGLARRWPYVDPVCFWRFWRVLW